MVKKTKNTKNTISLPTEQFTLIIALIVLVIFFSMFNRNYFSVINLLNILVAASVTGLAAIGETYLIIAQYVDLSAGSVVAFASTLTAVLSRSGFNFFETAFIVIAIGVLVGTVNAFAINKIKLEPFIATLATMSIMRGLAYISSGGLPVYINDESILNFGKNTFLGLQYSVWILIMAFIIFGIILARTNFGRSVYIIGGNKEAARLAGLEPQRITYILYIISGVLCSIGGIILAARMNSGQPSAANGLEFDAITGAVLGGTAFSGGVGTILGTVLGVFILQGFNTGLIMLNVPVFWQYVARGALLLIALTFDFIRKERREKELLSKSLEEL